MNYCLSLILLFCISQLHATTYDLAFTKDVQADSAGNTADIATNCRNPTNAQIEKINLCIIELFVPVKDWFSVYAAINVGASISASETVDSVLVTMKTTNSSWQGHPFYVRQTSTGTDTWSETSFCAAGNTLPVGFYAGSIASGTVNNQKIEFSVSPSIIQTALSGNGWFGFRVTVNTASSPVGCLDDNLAFMILTYDRTNGANSPNLHVVTH